MECYQGKEEEYGGTVRGVFIRTPDSTEERYGICM